MLEEHEKQYSASAELRSVNVTKSKSDGNPRKPKQRARINPLISKGPQRRRTVMKPDPPKNGIVGCVSSLGNYAVIALQEQKPRDAQRFPKQALCLPLRVHVT